MKLHSLAFHNFKGIKEASFELGKKSTVFIGVNGVGKSSILRGINLLYSRIINKIVKNRFRQGINIELSDISSGMPECKIEAEFILSDGSIVQYNRAMERKSKNRLNNEHALVLIHEVFEQLHLVPDSGMPMFVNYGVNRLVLDVPVRIRTKHTFDKESAFEKAIESRIDFRTFLNGSGIRKIMKMNKKPGGTEIMSIFRFKA
jgi:predicted ATP-binding protein involved in virulence